ncbi:MAG: hypothetical protein GKR89_12725 [Candidatus Latescibacteria bacterium]|nr:hypothetical protein [Candidatus Latescibacterota bacterium]
MPRLVLLLLLVAVPVPKAGAADSHVVKEVAHDLVCLCGTCNRESLATCLCGYAQEQRDELGAALDAGQTKDRIIADWVARFGNKVLATPPAQGYNLLAWIVPFVLLLAGVVLLRWVLVNWRATHAQTAPAAHASQPERSGAHRAQLQRELDQFDER